MTAAPSSDLRHLPRTACRVRATARCLGRACTAAVLDFSEEGLMLYLRSDIGAVAGRQVTVDTDEFGQLTGHVSWARFPHVGLYIGSSSNNTAKIESYFRIRRQA